MKPAKLTFLKAGKAVGAHPGFAATFNWLVRFCNNLSGDGITAQVDRQNDGDNPVVRCIGQLGGGGGGGGGGASYTGPIITSVEVDTTSTTNPRILFKGRNFTFANGLLTSVDQSDSVLNVINTVKHSNL